MEEIKTIENPAGGGVPAEGAPAAQPDRGAAFEELITGEYKAEFQARLEEVLARRLKNSRAAAEKLRQAEPLIEAAANRYGMDPEDVAGLTQALAAEPLAEDHPAAIADRLRREQEGLRQLYPRFNLGAELQNPLFKTLLQNKVDLRTAYEVVHHRELLPAALRAAESRGIRRAEENAARPVESAALPRGGSPGGTDFAHMTPKERAAVNRRALHGETIRF